MPSSPVGAGYAHHSLWRRAQSTAASALTCTGAHSRAARRGATPRAPAPTSSSDCASSSALVRHTTELSSDEYLQNNIMRFHTTQTADWSSDVYLQTAEQLGLHGFILQHEAGVKEPPRPQLVATAPKLQQWQRGQHSRSVNMCTRGITEAGTVRRTADLLLHAKSLV